jgi:hypothetical protein
MSDRTRYEYETILQIVAAEPGWRALHVHGEDDILFARVVCWGLIETDEKFRYVVGLESDGRELVPCTESDSFARYLAPGEEPDPSFVARMAKFTNRDHR